MRGGAWRVGNDDAGRYDDGDVRGSRACHEGWNGESGTLMSDKAAVIQTIRDIGIIPIVRAQSSDEAMKAIDAIRAGGISILEITMTVPGAVAVIEEVSKRYGSEALVGAGTVLDAETARTCILAG